MKSMRNIIKNIALVEARINELDSYTNYPYKAGHVVCVNKRLDIWETSKKNASMVSTQNCKLDRLVNQLKSEVSDSDQDYVLNELVENGMQVDIAYEYVRDWFNF